MTAVVDALDRHLRIFRETEAGLPGASLAWLKQRRQKAMARFAERGFPTTDLEEWRFTDVSPLAETPYEAAAGGAVPAGALAGIADGALHACQLTFVDGRYRAEFSTPEDRRPAGLRMGTLSGGVSKLERQLGSLLDEDGSPFTALNEALWSDGAFIHVPEGIVVRTPIHLLFVTLAGPAPRMTHPRVLIIADRDSKATLVESHVGVGRGVYLTNAVTEAALDDGAALDYCRLQREGRDAHHVSSLAVRQRQGSIFNSHAVSVGAAISRNEIRVTLKGEGAECALNGLYEATDAQLTDHHTTIDHATPRGTSRELYKGILDGKARAVFNGRVIVRPDAQKTDATQANKNLLLSEGALVNTTPQLEIFANDVKCKHGATVGQLDRDVLFYLRSRGIGEAEARRLLIHAFASEIADRIPIDAVRAQLGGCLVTMVGGDAPREYAV